MPEDINIDEVVASIKRLSSKLVTLGMIDQNVRLLSLGNTLAVACAADDLPELRLELLKALTPLSARVEEAFKNKDPRLEGLIAVKRGSDFKSIREDLKLDDLLKGTGAHISDPEAN